MNINETIKAALAVSQPVSDAVLSSLSWSGASRVANAIINNENLKLPVSMAKLACKVQSERIRPTTDEVINLLKTTPEKQGLSQRQYDALVEAGETPEAINASLEQDYQMALERHELQVRQVEHYEAAIRSALDQAFSAKTAKLPTFPEDMGDIKQRVISKVANRKPRIVSDLSYGRITAEQVKTEIKAINDFMAIAA